MLSSTTAAAAVFTFAAAVTTAAATTAAAADAAELQVLLSPLSILVHRAAVVHGEKLLNRSNCDGRKKKKKKISHLFSVTCPVSSEKGSCVGGVLGRGDHIRAIQLPPPVFSPQSCFKAAAAAAALMFALSLSSLLTIARRRCRRLCYICASLPRGLDTTRWLISLDRSPQLSLSLFYIGLPPSLPFFFFVFYFFFFFCFFSFFFCCDQLFASHI